MVITLKDTHKPNTTYSIDFSDAIQDNNEGNPLPDFGFTFSTGSVIDSMVVSGTVLNAANLEPVKGMLVGMHSNLADSAFTTIPFERVGRTDSAAFHNPGVLLRANTVSMDCKMLTRTSIIVSPLR